MKDSYNKTRPLISRRDFIGKTAIAAGGLSLAPFLLKQGRAGVDRFSEKGRPNILLFLTDQQHWKAIGALGNPMLHTPAQDRLVRGGVTVENNYCTSPVSKPSRSSLLTGRMPTETGVWINTSNQPSRSLLDPTMPSLGQWLRDKAGYETIYAGKYHLSETNTYDIPGFRVIAGGSDHRGDLGDMQVSRACEAYIRQYAEGDRQNPFLMVCSLVQPHDICHWLSINQNKLEQPWYPGMERIAPLPPIPGNFNLPGQEPSRVRSVREGQQPAQGQWDAEQWRYYLWSYYRHVEMVDAEIDRVLSALEESGLDGNTLVVLTSDHGEGMGEQQMVRKGFLYDSATRVPLVARFPGVIPAGLKLSETLASGLDLMPTFCDYAGVEIPPGLLHARSLKANWEGNENKSSREALVIEENDGDMKGKDANKTGRKLRTHRYSYIRYYDDPNEMLFDMEVDPGETSNLAGDIVFKSILEEHRFLLREWESQLVIHRHVPEMPWKNLGI
jgi:arylsulfatase A-like enzyme